MGNQLKGSFYYFLTNMRRPFLIFWAVLGGFMVLTYSLSYLFASTDTVIIFDFSFPIYIFGAVFGFIAVRNCIPYLIRMGATRSNIFMTAGLSFLSLAIVNALLANTIYQVIDKVFSGENAGIFTIQTEEQSFTFSHLADLVMNNTWYSRLVIDTSIGFFLLAIFFIIGLVFYRFGFVGGFGMLGIFMATFVLGVTKGWLIEFFMTIFKDFNFIFFYQLLLTGILIYLLSYLFMRRLTI